MFNDPKNRKYLEYASLGVEIAASFAVPILAGYWLDEKFQTSPWFLLSGIFLGIVLMLAIFIRIARDTGNKS
ncbi:AtpZ/AtpI family protein [Rhodohalobacter sp. 614A]|uniref:AtpZ/AtpI family protein n=1 Tax=Rhodohalobacter sp. 614A TaxID=2908649 RepID=UPI00351DA45E